MGDIELNWDAPNDWGGDKEHYNILRGTSSGSLNEIDTVGSSTTTYTDTGVTNGTTYYYAVEAENGAGTSNDSNEVSITPLDPPTSPSNTQTTVVSDEEIEVTWTGQSDWGGEEGHYNILRGTSSGNYSQVGEVDSSTTSYSDTGLSPGTTYYYVIESENSDGTSSTSNESSSTTYDIPSSPGSVSATVDESDQISLSWDSSNWNGEQGDYRIEINRDGSGFVSPSGGPNTVSAGTTTATYNADGGSDYGTQVGMDSSFQFRVRGENSVGNSSWTSSSTVYTDPIPPHNPSVSRPDGNTIIIDVEKKSDITSRIDIFVREDTGSGYGSWKWYDQPYYSDLPKTYEVGTQYEGNHVLSENTRYQFYLQGKDPSHSKVSGHVYSDYGNEGNVFFEAGFETGDFSSWDTVSNTNNATVNSGSDSYSGVSGADEGTYYARLNGGAYIEKELGDLSGESNVFVKFSAGVSWLNTGDLPATIEFYDGSSWVEVESLGAEMNHQGWTEVHADVPDSALNTDSRIRISAPDAGVGVFDRVVVTDILHEYTQPAEPTNLSFDTSVDSEITVSWDDNSPFKMAYDFDYKDSESSTWVDEADADNAEYTVTGLPDGKTHDARVRAFVEQDRNGVRDEKYTSSFTSGSTVTKLPQLEDFTADLI